MPLIPGPEQHEGQRCHQIALDISTADMHGGERTGDAVVRHKIKQAGKRRTLPQHIQHFQRQPQRHAQRQPARSARRVIPCAGQQRDKCEREKQAFRRAQRIKGARVVCERIEIERTQGKKSEAEADRRGE